VPDRPPARRPHGPPPDWGLSAPAYAVLGGAGVVLFLAAIVTPVLANLPQAALLRVGLAATGGFLAVVGIGRWNVLRQYSRRGRRPSESDLKAEMPSIEFFSPPAPPGEERPRRRTAPYTARPLARASLVVVLGVIAILLLSALPSVPGTAGSAAPAPAALAPARATGAPPTPTCDPPFYPVYTDVDGLDPPLPKYSDQSPCQITHDEVHATFASGTSGSGEQVNFPIHLPGNGTFGPSSEYTDAYLGMVVSGDSSSVDGQSYAELVMTPGSNATGVDWSLTVAIWSLLLNTSCSSGLNFTWLNEYGCEVDDAAPGGHTSLATNLPGDTFANVTFFGSVSGPSGTLTIGFNDSSDPAYSANYTASAATTGTDTFRPYYDSACPDLCYLNWSSPFGLGLGIDLCDALNCYSYNATAQAATAPIELFSPEYFNGISFRGDYQFVAYESSTGACSGATGVAGCTLDAEIGEYPAFTFNGTSIDFGGNYSWTTETFGGAPREFNALSTATDFVPLFVDELTNSSRAGYVAPGVPLNVSVRIQDLGSLKSVNLSYQPPGATERNTSMTLVAGSASDGFYNASVPDLGANGTISFRVVVVNRARESVSLPPVGYSPNTVLREAIPMVTAGLDQSPPGCGGLSIDGGAVEPNGSSTTLLAGFYPLRSDGCYPYVFSGWATTGGLSISGGSGRSTEVELHANGTVAALWSYVTPHDTVALAFSPSGCGTITLNGTVVRAPGHGPLSLVNGRTYSLNETPCAGDAFGGWSVSSTSNLTILGANLTVDGNGTVSADFVNDASSYPLLFETAPSGCGGVRLGTAGYVNGSTVNLLPGSPQPVGPFPCAGYGYAAGNVSTAGGASLAGGSVSLSAAGSIQYRYYRLTLVDIVTSPAGCGGIEFDGILESSGVELNLTNHTVHTVLAEPCSGYYVQAFVAFGDLSLSGTVLTVNGPGTLEASFRAGVEEYWVGFISEPITCGQVTFDGTGYGNSEFDYVLPDSTHSLGVTSCAGYGFVSWQVSGGVSLADPATDATNLAVVNGSGSIEAIFHPLVAVEVETNPATCGGIVIDGFAYGNGASPLFPEGATFPVEAVPCTHTYLSAWQTSGGAAVAGGNLTLTATAIVLAVFLTELYPVHIAIDPASCGPLTLDGLEEQNNTTVPLPAGLYTLGTSPCTGFELLQFATDAGLSVSGLSLDVNGAGNLTEEDGPVPPALSLAVPATAGIGTTVYVSVAVAVPVPPYNYTYAWSFGDGSTATTPSNFTSHTYARGGTYEVSVTVTDPYGRVATADENVSVVAGPSAAALGIGPLGLAIILGGVAIVVAGAVVTIVRARRPRAPPGDGSVEEAP
jgi:hypothetical protein